MTPIERKARELLAAEVRHSDFYVERDAVLRAIAAALRSAQVPEGWVPVPREPTEAMTASAVEYMLSASVSGAGGWPLHAAQVWTVMLAAAPSAEGV